MKKQYTKYTLRNIKVNIVEAKTDYREQVQISVLGEPEFNRKPFGEYRDTLLEAEGWKFFALVNGSLFFTVNGETFSNGIEKSQYVVHENDDATWDNNLGFYHEQSVPYIYTQGYIKSIINKPNVRGAITGAFGLINNGQFDNRGGRRGDPCRTIYLQRSGRTIIGKKADGTIVMATFDGITGSTGLTGYETYLLAKSLGLRNAICMDGGGSTYMKVYDKVVNSSSREGSTAIALYYK